MDAEFISRLKKSLDDLYVTKLQILLYGPDGDSKEARGFIKAIKAFGDMIEENIERPK